MWPGSWCSGRRDIPVQRPPCHPHGANGMGEHGDVHGYRILCPLYTVDSTDATVVMRSVTRAPCSCVYLFPSCVYCPPLFVLPHRYLGTAFLCTCVSPPLACTDAAALRHHLHAESPQIQPGQGERRCQGRAVWELQTPVPGGGQICTSGSDGGSRSGSNREGPCGSFKHQAIQTRAVLSGTRSSSLSINRSPSDPDICF